MSSKSFSRIAQANSSRCRSERQVVDEIVPRHAVGDEAIEGLHELRHHFGPCRVDGTEGGMHVAWHLPAGAPPAVPAATSTAATSTTVADSIVSQEPTGEIRIARLVKRFG